MIYHIFTDNSGTHVLLSLELSLFNDGNGWNSIIPIRKKWGTQIMAGC